MPDLATLVIKPDLEPQEVKSACDIYLNRIAVSGPLAVDFSEDSPNIFAIQVALACKRSLQEAGHFAGFGPLAQQSLGRLLQALPDAEDAA